MDMNDPFKDVQSDVARTYGWRLYHETCTQLGHPGARDTDHPADFEHLTTQQQRCVLYWIGRVLLLADRSDSRTSESLREDFEREGFVLTNGQFKGAMLRSGYPPRSIGETNWAFRIKRAVLRSINYEGGSTKDWERYSLGRFNQRFALLLIEAGYLTC